MSEHQTGRRAGLLAVGAVALWFAQRKYRLGDRLAAVLETNLSDSFLENNASSFHSGGRAAAAAASATDEPMLARIAPKLTIVFALVALALVEQVSRTWRLCSGPR